jgi:hypothetical protein
MRQRIRLLAIPPESVSDEMSRLVCTINGVYIEGERRADGNDYLCGRCGRLLALKLGDGQVRNLWLTCPGCSWINGVDVDLGWAQYVADELQERKLSIQRIEELVLELKEELKEGQDTAEAFLKRNPDVAKGPVGWMARISLAAVLTILSLLLTIYYGQHQTDLAQEQVDLAREQLKLAQDESPAAEHDPPVLTAQDIKRLVKELHALQVEIQQKPPPKSTRGKRSKRNRP